jgi:hypothetical protein
MNTHIDIEGNPSKCLEVLKKVEGRTIVSMSRFSSWSYQKYMSTYYLRQSPESRPAKNNFFSWLSGSLLLELDSGLIIGFNVDPKLHSIFIWIETNEIGERDEHNLLIFNEDLFLIKAVDKEYSNDLVEFYRSTNISYSNLKRKYTIRHLPTPAK